MINFLRNKYLINFEVIFFLFKDLFRLMDCEKSLKIYFTSAFLHILSEYLIIKKIIIMFKYLFIDKK